MVQAYRKRKQTASDLSAVTLLTGALDAHVLYVIHVQYVKQNLTISLDRQTLRKAKILAAKRATSISGLVAAQIDALVDEDEAYEKAKRQALALLDRGFHLGGRHRIDRETLHER